MTEETKKKIIAVIGATGQQGSGLVRAILAESSDDDAPFAVRALTRDPTKVSKDSYLAGVEVVAFDIDKPETHAAALAGVYGLFVVTNFWEHMDAHHEAKQVEAVVKAGTEAGVEHFVWSTLEDTTPFFDSLPEAERPPKIHGLYVPHLDVKGQSNALFPASKTTMLYTSFYLENLYKFQMVSNGVLCNNLGNVVFPVIAADDIGKCAYGIFKAGDEYKGKSVYIAGDKKTCTEIMQIVSQVTGKSFSYAAVDRATYAGFGFPGADDLANMFEYDRLDPAFGSNRDVELSRKLNPELQNVQTWAEGHVQELLALAPKEG